MLLPQQFLQLLLMQIPCQLLKLKGPPLNIIKILHPQQLLTTHPPFRIQLEAPLDNLQQLKLNIRQYIDEFLFLLVFCELQVEGELIDAWPVLLLWLVKKLLGSRWFRILTQVG